MNIQFLGFGSAFNPAFKNTNSYFTIGDNLYFIDFGETAFETVKAQKKIENYKDITVIVTHLHADHVGSLPTFISYVYYILGKTVNVIHPNDNIIKLLDLTGIERECYSFSYDIPHELAEQISIWPIMVEHVPNMDTYGYIIEAKGERIYISGDAANVPQRIIDELESGSIDRLYQDTSSEDGVNPTHCPFNTLKKLIKQEFRHKVTCIHLDKDFRDEIEKEGFLCIR